MFAALHGSGDLLRLAFEFSPTVEHTAPSTVVFDVSGLDRLFGIPQEVAAAIARRAAECGVSAGLALAATPEAALYAARASKCVSVIPYGDEAKFLAAYPVALLNPSPELAETLERWGVRRFQDLAALPPLGIAERLGPEGLRLHQQARGGWPRKLVPVEEPARYADSLELDYPVDLLEPLAFVLSRLLNGLATRLATRALATDELRLRLTLENRATHERVLRLPVPTLDVKALLKLLHLDLAAHPPQSPVVAAALEANPVKPRAAQSGLFLPLAPEPVKLELTIARIEALVGPGHVGAAELLDTHRPGAFRMTRFGHAGAASAIASTATTLAAVPESRLALRVFRPPRPARVTVEDGQPSYVLADGVRGRIVSMAGPWRTSGDWWTTDPWARDEWDVALTGGALYRIFCAPHGWFVEGSYD
jgi:protein ImuB